MNDIFTENYTFVNYNNISDEDIIKILQIRNSYEVRRWMVNDTEIPLESHLKFVASLKANDTKDYFIIKDSSEKIIGSVNIDYLDTGIVERGIFINPEFQKRGHAYNSMKELYEILAQSGIKKIITKVKADNQPSNALELKLGAVHTHTSGNYNHYILSI